MPLDLITQINSGFYRQIEPGIKVLAELTHPNHPFIFVAEVVFWSKVVFGAEDHLIIDGPFLQRLVDAKAYFSRTTPTRSRRSHLRPFSPPIDPSDPIHADRANTLF